MKACKHERVKSVKHCGDAECKLGEAFQCKDCSVFLHATSE